MASISDTNANVVSPYGGMSQQAFQRFSKQYGNPMAWGFGLGTGNRAMQFRKGLEEGKYDDSPLGQFIMQGREFLPSMFGDAQRVGEDIASRAPAAFEQYQNQVQGYLESLPGYQSLAKDAAMGARDVTGRAGQMVEEAFNPIASQTLFQDALRQATESSQQGAAARGMLDSGSAQAGEEIMSRDLASQFANRRFQEQGAALQGLSGAQQSQAGLAQGGAGLSGAGIDAAGGILQALPQLMSLMQSGTQLPFNTLGQLMQFFGGTQNPSLAIGQATAPQVATEGKGVGIL